jgi:hypothetical protein
MQLGVQVHAETLGGGNYIAARLIVRGSIGGKQVNVGLQRLALVGL